MHTLKHKQQFGFTIVELLIVIVVIGILAAITIVAFNGVQNKARLTVLKSDLAQAAKTMESFKVQDSSENYPADLAAAKTAGLKGSSDTVFQYSVNNTTSPKTYCITATTQGVFGTAFYTTQTGGVNDGTCPGQSPTGTPNLIANSSFETASSAVTIRTNYAKDPSAANTVGYFATVGTPATSNSSIASDKSHNGTTSYKKDITGTGQLSGITYIDGSSLRANAGETVSWSFWMYSTKAGAITPYAEGSKVADGTYTGFTGGSAVTVPANTWTKVTGKSVLTVDTYVSKIGAYNLPVVGGDTAWFDEFLVEKADAVGNYFDGSTTSSGDFSYSWSGATNGSISTQQGTSIASTSINRVTAIQSSDWSSAGAKSIRLIPNSAASPDSYLDINNLVIGGVSSLKPNTTYTIKAKLRLPQALTGSLLGGSQQLSVFVYLNGSNRGAWVAPNTAGEYVLGGTFTTPSVFTGYNSIRLYHGGLIGAGDVWWDDVLLVERNYTGAYFE